MTPRRVDSIIIDMTIILAAVKKHDSLRKKKTHNTTQSAQQQKKVKILLGECNALTPIKYVDEYKFQQ